MSGPQDLETVFLRVSQHMTGISGPSRFTAISNGIRGYELTRHSTYNILCKGGSTAECLHPEQEETGPHLVQVLLQKNLGSQHRVWGGNIGKSGFRTREHLLQMEKLLSELSPIAVKSASESPQIRLESRTCARTSAPGRDFRSCRGKLRYRVAPRRPDSMTNLVKQSA